MTQFETLIDFIHQTEAQFRIFDMGRRISKLSAENFRKVELGHIPYPLPFLHQAWVGVLMWNPKAPAENVVWFLKLPLDEQGFLVQAARDDFLNRLMQNLIQNSGKTPLQQQNDENGPRDALKDNPFSFTPDQEKMAAFHATATLTTAQPASLYYEHAQQYFSGQHAIDQWESVGYQGIADFVIRHQQGNNEALLTRIIPSLPDLPLEAVCTSVEHIQPGAELTDAIANRLQQAIGASTATPNHIGALVRAISQGPDEQQKVALLTAVLESDYGIEPEVIAAIASRCWATLQHPELLKPFLETLAINKAGQASFNRIMADLMFIPTLRALSLQIFRNPERSNALGKAIGGMFGEGVI
ncbi:MAG: DUF3549 family protein [Amphritea sp.]